MGFQGRNKRGREVIRKSKVKMGSREKPRETQQILIRDHVTSALARASVSACVMFESGYAGTEADLLTSLFRGGKSPMCSSCLCLRRCFSIMSGKKKESGIEKGDVRKVKCRPG